MCVLCLLRPTPWTQIFTFVAGLPKVSVLTFLSSFTLPSGSDYCPLALPSLRGAISVRIPFSHYSYWFGFGPVRPRSHPCPQPCPRDSGSRVHLTRPSNSPALRLLPCRLFPLLLCSGHANANGITDVDQTKRALVPRDFEFLKLIGRGTFGRVFQVRKKDTRRIYAMKVLSKKEIIAKKEIAHTIGERKILQQSLNSPFLVGLKFSFQTDTDLYLVTDFKSGGELFWHLQKETKFSEERARFYIAELVLALEHLHKYDIVYRSVSKTKVSLCRICTDSF